MIFTTQTKMAQQIRKFSGDFFEKVRKTNGSSEKKQRQHFLGLPKSLSFTFFLGELHWVCYWRTLPTVSQIVW